MSNFRNVKEFHFKFDVRMARSPSFLNRDLFRFRMKFMHEELDEFFEAHEARDIAKAADALIDLVYVAMGTAAIMGLPWELLWSEVQRANMQKQRAQSVEQSAESTGRGHATDVIKPPGWLPPNHMPMLQIHGYREPIVFDENQT